MAHQLTHVFLAIAMPVLTCTAPTHVHAQTCTPPAVLTMIHSFDNNFGDPRSTVYPGIVAQGRDGNLYTTSFAGGQGSTADGTKFRVTPSGALTVVYSFDLFNFHSPASGLTLGKDGFFYGTSTVGSGNSGTIFKADSSGNVIVPVLHNFTGLGDGGDRAPLRLRPRHSRPLAPVQHKISVRLLDSFPSSARDKRSLHAIRVSAMVYFSLFEIYEEVPVKQTEGLLL